MMRSFAKISPKFWIGKTGREIRGLGIEAQLIALYLMTSPHSNMIGIYYLPIDYVAHDTGIPLEGASKGLLALCEINFCSFDAASEYVWVHEMALYQVGGQLKSNDKRVMAINDSYFALPDLPFLADFYEKYQQHFHLTQSRCNAESDSNIHDLISPSDAPSMDHRSKEKEKRENIVAPARPCMPEIPIDINQIFDHWKTVMNHPNAKLDDKRKAVIRKALKAGYSTEQLCHAITGCSYTPHNMGDNDRGQRYDGLHVILRDGDQIDRFMHNYHQPPRPITDADRKTQANVQTLERWMNKKIAEEEANAAK